MSLEKLLNLRKVLKAKKPRFTRQDSHKKPRLGTKWRRPKGIDSKMRLKLRGYKRSVTKGWKSPKKVRGLTREGQTFVKINRVSELEGLDAKTHMVVISSAVGLKNKVEIVKKAKELGLKILNVRDAEQFLKKVEAKLREKKLVKEKLSKEKEKKKEEKEKIAAEKEKEKGKKEEVKEAAEKKTEQKEDLAGRIDVEAKMSESKIPSISSQSADSNAVLDVEQSSTSSDKIGETEEKVKPEEKTGEKKEEDKKIEEKKEKDKLLTTKQ